MLLYNAMRTQHARWYRMRVSWKYPDYADPAAMEILQKSGQGQLQEKFAARELT